MTEEKIVEAREIIENQYEEIKSLKNDIEQYERMNKRQFKMLENSISKDKIREKIKELEDWNSEYSNRINHHQEYTLTALVQNLLKELLKGE